MSALQPFHPAVAAWFHETLGEPTKAQELAWPLLHQGADALVAAPTGSGKTLVAFLAALDELARDAAAGTLQDEVRVVYVSPLKALSHDIGKNLLQPLQGIAARLPPGAIPIRADVRTGDTDAKARARTKKHPPHILVTTPESLFVLLTTVRGKKLLSTTRTVIVDEIHAVAGTRRGAHLALTLERLEEACGRKLQRVGLSATQRPIERVAGFLVGDRPLPHIVDTGHARRIDLDIEVPKSPLEPVMSREVWDDVVGRIADLVLSHKTTLVFVNTRRTAERVAARLDEFVSERLRAQGSEPAPNARGLVCAHHGSMARDKRLDAEDRLKRGELRALVATSSLELGIDVGSIDLVCQLGSTRSIAALLQRVGRAGHQKHLTPKGRIFPLSRDELIEAVALVDAVHSGDLDELIIPSGGLDVLGQHLIAACADVSQDEEDWSRDRLLQLARRAWPYRDLEEKTFDDVLTLAADGVQTDRGRRGAWLFFDRTTGAVRGRKGARIAALTSGGAIPDNGDYTVIEEPAGNVVGTINEDFAIESIPGDIFQLGTTAWRLLRVERGQVRVEDARGQPPTVPFWLGEAPARTHELSTHVSLVREVVESLAVEHAVEHDHDAPAIIAALAQRFGISIEVARQLSEYLLAARAALGRLPTKSHVVFERFEDSLGGVQIVVHSPFGSRINRAWGLSLRKRFCRSFDFELQAAATEDAILLSIGAIGGVEIGEISKFVNSRNVCDVLVQAILQAPMFGTRFRWNATRALTVLRNRSGKRVPPGLVRIAAEDILVAAFPEQVACAENIVGDREVPDHVLVQQTLQDCLQEAMDIDGLVQLLTDIETGRITVSAVERAEPSPLAFEVLSARPYAFLDDVPLEERRVQAVLGRRPLGDPSLEDESMALSPQAVAAVLEEVHPVVESADEAWDALVVFGALREEELVRVCGPRMPALVADLLQRGRAQAGGGLIVAVEKVALLSAATHELVLDALRGRLEVGPPRTAATLIQELGMPEALVAPALDRLAREGVALRGHFDGSTPTELTLWSRRLVTRARRRMLDRLRAEIEPVSAQTLMRMLLRWQRVDEQAHGPEGLRTVLQILDGLPAAAAAWEESVLPARVADYQPAWLDALCLSGELRWVCVGGTASSVVRAAPVALCSPETAALLAQPGAASGEPTADLSADARAVQDALRRRGASFFRDLQLASGRLRTQAEAGLAELVARGLVASDGFAGLRALLLSGKDKERLERRTRGRLGFGTGLDVAGRWALVDDGTGLDDASLDADERTEAVARLLLKRFGVVFRRLIENRPQLPPWRDLLRALRRLEVRGEVRGGRFVQGFSGEQFARPDAVALLRSLRREELKKTRVVLSAADPLNFTGQILPGPRVAAIPGHRLLLEDGIVLAVLDGEGTHTPDGSDLADAGEVRRALEQPVRRGWLQAPR